MTGNISKCYLDSNVLIALKDQDSLFHQQAQKILTQLIKRQTNLYFSSLTIDEFLFQIQHLLRKAGFTPQENEILKESLESVLSLPKTKIINPPTEPKKQLLILNLMRDYRLRPRDAYHLLTMKSAGIKTIATFDHDFDLLAKKGKVTIVR